MGNTVTPLIPSIIASIQDVARELIPLKDIVNLDSRLEGAAKDQAVTVPGTAVVAGTNITPGATSPGGSALTTPSQQVTLSKARAFPFTVSGEELQSMTERGAGFVSAELQEAIRACANEIYTDAVAFVAQGAGYALGTQGTNPFASNTDFMADLKKSLDDGIAPASGRVLVIDTTSDAALGKLGINTQAYQAGTDSILRSGEKLPLQGFRLPLANVNYSHTKGTGANYQINKAGGYAIGDKALTVDTGNGTIVAGDVVTFAGHTTKYVAAGLSGTTLTLNAPLVAAVADDEAITVGNGGTRLAALVRPALSFAVRPPALPTGGDSARGREMFYDPISGLTFSIAHYVEYMQEKWMVEAVWGGKIVRSLWARQGLSN